MTKYVLKRLVLMIFTFLIITTICFVLIKLLPLPAIKQMGRDVSLIERRREAMGYNKPIMVQYVIYWQHLLKGDLGLGEQMYVSLEVSDVMLTKLPYTVVVNLYAFIVSVPLGLIFGIYAALKKNTWQDHVISTLVMVFISVPSFVYAFLVQYLLCFKTGWFPLRAFRGAHGRLSAARPHEGTYEEPGHRPPRYEKRYGAYPPNDPRRVHRHYRRLDHY